MREAKTMKETKMKRQTTDRRKRWMAALAIVAAAAMVAGCTPKQAEQAAAETTVAETTATETTAAETTAAEETAAETTAADTAAEAAAETTAADAAAVEAGEKEAAEDGKTVVEIKTDDDEVILATEVAVMLGDTEVFLVPQGGFVDPEGILESIEAEVFMEKDGERVSLGVVESTSTAYPLAVKDGMLYTASHRTIQKTTVKDGALVVAEEATMKFDDKDNPIYSYVSAENGEAEDPDGAEFERMFTEYDEAEILDFALK